MKLKSLALTLLIASTAATFAAKPPPGGRGRPSVESAEMQGLIESFHLTAEQRAKYGAAKAETGRQMREIHEGKMAGTLPQEEVLKKALASHKAFNAAVKEILTPEQFAQWEPLREADHHKVAEAHKKRDEAAKVERSQ